MQNNYGAPNLAKRPPAKQLWLVLIILEEMTSFLHVEAFFVFLASSPNITECWKSTYLAFKICFHVMSSSTRILHFHLLIKALLKYPMCLMPSLPSSLGLRILLQLTQLIHLLSSLPHQRNLLYILIISFIRVMGVYFLGWCY